MTHPAAFDSLPGAIAAVRSSSRRSAWLVSFPLLMAALAYLFAFRHGKYLLRDGDTYWHVATGQWIFLNGSVPMTDPFSHSMRGAVWTAHEWLSDVILAAAHHMGGWTLVVAIIALAFATTIALMTRALLRTVEPIHALLFAVLAILMTAGHVLARPHMLAMPLMMVWTIELVRASESNRSPGFWLLPVMTVWANLHGGFTLGIALACAFALEALLAAAREQRIATARSWGIFLALSVASALVTPHGTQGILFTWQILFDHSYALERVGEWRSPNFQSFQPLEYWLLGGFALIAYQGLRLPPVRLLLLLGLLHLALKHIRNVELVGLLAPLFVAAPFARQWRERQQAKQQLESADRFFRYLSQPAGWGALVIGLLMIVAVPIWSARARSLEPPESVAPVRALEAVQQAGIKGPVLNSYGSGGYLVFKGIPVFIDGRADMYGDSFLKKYVEALELRAPDGLEKLLAKYDIAWTLLEPGSSAVALLDRLPHWRRLYTDKTAVVHVKTGPHAAAVQVEATTP
jgi:hypothetical protein